MNRSLLRLALILSAAAPALPQATQSDLRTFRFVNVKSDTADMEMITTIRQAPATRLFFHWATLPSPEVKQMVNEIRAQAKTHKVFDCYSTHTLAVRGTAEQLTTVKQLVGRTLTSQLTTK